MGFGLKLRLDWSKKQYIDEVRNPHELADGSQSYGDFSRDRNNRFDTPERAAKNRIIPPTQILHFYNVPKLEDEEMLGLFAEKGSPAPNKIKWFPAKSDKSVSGLVEFENVQDACEALVMVNHTATALILTGQFNVKMDIFRHRDHYHYHSNTH